MIAFENVSFRYPKAAEDTLTGFSCAFAPGECAAVTGKNGCGKTTLARLLTGIVRPTSGRVLIDGQSTEKMDLWSIAQMVGCVFQDPSRQLFCSTVREEIEYGLKNKGLPASEISEKTLAALRFFRLEAFADAFPGRLSQGEKQRVALAAVLALETRYVLLDEPASSLDMRARKELGELLLKVRDAGRGVIFISHERAFIEKYADRELVME